MKKKRYLPPIPAVFTPLLFLLLATLAAEAQDLIAHWSFDSTDGAISYYDMTGNGYTAVGTRSMLTDGVHGTALGCDGEPFDIAVENSLDNFNVEQFTIEAWVYANSSLVSESHPDNQKGIFEFATTGLEGSGVAKGYCLKILDNGHPICAIAAPEGGSWQVCEGPAVLLPQRWYYLAGTYDGTTVKLYVNGEQVHELDAPGGYAQADLEARIGCQLQVTDTETMEGQTRQWFDGNIDDLKLYDYAVDAETIASQFDQYLTVEIEPSLIAHWSFDSSSADKTFYDVTGHGYDAICSRTLGLQEGVEGDALESSTDAYTFPVSNSQEQFAFQEFSIEALVHLNTLPPAGKGYIIFSTQGYSDPDVLNGLAEGYSLEIIDDGRLQLTLAQDGSSSWAYCRSTTKMKISEWYHVTGTYDGNIMKVYVNGAHEVSLAQEKCYVYSRHEASIGCQRNVNGTTRNFFDGMIDELKLYNYALDADEVHAGFEQYMFPLQQEPMLVAHWSFDSTDGKTSYYDMTGNGYTAVSSRSMVTEYGVNRSALDCDGGEFDVAVKNSPGNFNFEQFTISAWIYANSSLVSASHPDNQKGIFEYATTGPEGSGVAKGYCFKIFDNGHPFLSLASPHGGSWRVCEGPDVLQPQHWYHLAATYDGEVAKLYVNGEQVKELNASGGYMVPDLEARIGCQFQVTDDGTGEGETRQWFDGRIDEIRVFNYARDAAGIEDDFKQYELPEPDPAPFLIAHWSFDSSSENTTFYDVTGNGYDATCSEQLGTTDGVVGEALESTVGGYTFLADNSHGNFTVPTFSIEAYIYSYIDLVNIGSFYNARDILSYQTFSPGVAKGYNLDITDHGVLQLSLANTESTWATCTGETVLKPRTWYHVVGTYDGTTMAIYINGELEQTLEHSGGYIPPDQDAALACQAQVDGGDIRNWFNGMIDELKLYGAALSADTIKSIYEATPLPDDPAFEINLGMKTVYAQPGDEIVMPIYIANHEDYSISSCQFVMQYDPEQLTLTSITKDEGVIAKWELFDWNEKEDGSVTVAMGGTSTVLDYGEGELVRAVFVVSDNVSKNDTCRIGLSDIDIDEGKDLVVTTSQEGRIIISDVSILYGDVTGNDEVTISDAQKVLSFVVGALSLPDSVCCPNFTVAVADVSGNGTITSYDASLIFQYSIGLIPSFPVETALEKVLAKRSATTGLMADLDFAVRQDSDELIYELVGSGLGGFYAGEFAIECDAEADLISKSTISTNVRGATLNSRYSAADKLLKVAISSNDDIDDDEQITILRISLPPVSEKSAPEFTIRSALINEGAIATDYDDTELTGIRTSLSFPPLRKRASVQVGGNRLVVRIPESCPAVLAVWNLRGQRVATRVIQRNVEIVDVRRYGKGAYVYRLQHGQKVLTGRFMLLQ